MLSFYPRRRRRKKEEELFGVDNLQAPEFLRLNRSLSARENLEEIQDRAVDSFIPNDTSIVQNNYVNPDISEPNLSGNKPQVPNNMLFDNKTMSYIMDYVQENPSTKMQTISDNKDDLYEYINNRHKRDVFQSFVDAELAKGQIQENKPIKYKDETLHEKLNLINQPKISTYDGKPLQGYAEITPYW